MAAATKLSTPAANFTCIDAKVEAPDVHVSTALHFQNNHLSEPFPYWLVNVPRSQWPAECPEFLRDLPPKSIEILSTPDAQYKRQDWATVQEITKSGQINLFQRLPSDLRKYLEYREQIIAKYGSIVQFVVKERLRWGDGHAEDLKPKGRPFEYDEDIKILYNDWPYGVEKTIIHLVVWTKFELEEEPGTDELTPETKNAMDDYMKKMFLSRVPAEKVIWFKNWKSLKSVHAIEHFHVMLKDPDMEFIKEITQGDVPMIARV